MQIFGVPAGPGDDSCYLVGNAQLYPLGIRTGFYLQWFATILANFFVPSDSKAMRGTNTVFTLAMFAGLCYASTNLERFDAIEGFVMLTFCIGSITSLTTSPNMNIRVTRLGSIGRLMLFLAIFMFGAWFWFEGHQQMMHTACTQQTQFFFFWKINLYHWFQKFSQAIMVLGSIGVGAGLIWELFQLVTVLRRDGARSTFSAIADGRLVKDTVLGGVLLQDKYSWVSGALLMIILIVQAAFVVTIEGAFKYSNAYLVYNLNSVTDLVPFTIGLLSVIRVTIGMIRASVDAIYGRKDAKELDNIA